MEKNREKIPEKYKWNIEALYKDIKTAEAEIPVCLEMAEAFRKYTGKLGYNSETLLSALKDKDALWLKAERIYVYAHQKKDEDNTLSEAQALYDKVQAMLAKISEAASFFAPEFAVLDEKTVREWINCNEELKLYSHYIECMLREKAHILSAEKEALLASLSELTGCPDDTFSMLNDADFDFGYITGEDGNKIHVTHGSYGSLMQNRNRTIRRMAYEHIYKVYESHRNSLASLYSYNVKQDSIYSRIRGYESSRSSALYGDNIPMSVYDSLVNTVNRHLPALHRYVALRKKLLGLKKLKMYDLYVPVTERPDNKYSYEEAQQIIFRALKPLGEEYLNALRHGFESRWADVYETPGKRSGAYSFGSYDSDPYVLLNFDGRLEDVFTVIHEMGHSMHSWYTRKTQPFIYGGHSIFTAEVASTVNESLLMQYLINNAADKKEKAYILNMYLDAFRSTLFRQTQFAEFEDRTHSMAEAGDVLTADSLSKLYGDINAKYYGSDVAYDKYIALEWSRIPHFYRAFYVYQYATGYSAATAISTAILRQGEPAAKAYIEFLKSGSSDFPIELLKIAGVDMSSPAPVEAAMLRFEELLSELESLVND